jgi:hypothetical protein
MSLVRSILSKSEGETSREPMSVEEPMEEEPEVEQMEMDLGAEEAPKGLMARM